MSTSVGELESLVLQVLQKTPGSQGFYTPDKVRAAVQESLDYVSSRMMLAVTGGWVEEIRHYNTVSGQATVQLQGDVVVIKNCRYLIGNTYIPLAYDEGREITQYVPTSGITQFPNHYRVLGDNIYFNPPLGVGGEQYLQLEVTAFPMLIKSGNDQLPTKFHRAFQHYIKYRSASCLASSIGKFNKEWSDQQTEWLDVVMRLIDLRVDVPQYVKEWDS